MKIVGDYQKDGYAHLQGLFPPDVVAAFLNGLKEDLAPTSIPLSQASNHANVLGRPAYEVYGPHYKPMLFFLWALTPLAAGIVGRELLPSYNWFRIYRGGDVCRVHSDRPSCEHSMTLTLGYSDGLVWDFQVGGQPIAERQPIAEDFGSDPFTTVAMDVGDAVVYQGVSRRHGRFRTNPNAWSAHLFLHWVEKDGPRRAHAFEDGVNTERPDFTFI